MTYLFIDTETTGLGKSDVVLQLAYQVFADDNRPLLGQNNYLAHRFDYEIHPEAAKVNGLTIEKINKLCKRPKLIKNHLAYLSDWTESAIFVGHNIDFDLRLIRQTCERYGVEFPATVNTICTKNGKGIKEHVGAKDKNCRLKAPSLVELHRHLFNEEFDNAHDALADVKATARCFFELKRLGLL